MLGNRYELLGQLGSGGMAVVWRARDEVLGRSVAVKVLAARYAGDRLSRDRIREEARSAATLSHPNIAQVYDYGEATGGGVPLPYVVMELIDGATLQQRVASSPLPPRTIFRICGEVAAALAAAHAHGLVHRDIKMANIMVTPAGAKVVDFGIAAAVGRTAPEENLVGTPAYLAPERLTGDEVVPASDIYALGVLLYRLLAHESPWSVETTTQMLKAHVYVEPTPLPRLPGVPPPVADLISRCLRKDPAKRPTAGEVSATLADAAEASAAAAAEVPVAGPVPAEVEVAGAASASVPEPVARQVPEPRRPTGAHVPRRATGAAVIEAGPGGPLPAEMPTVSIMDSALRTVRPEDSVGPGAIPAAVGGRRRLVPPRKLAYLLAGGGLVALLTALLMGWLWPSDPAAEPREAVVAPGSAPPAVRDRTRAPRPSAAGENAKPVRPEGSGRAPASASASAAVVSSAPAVRLPPGTPEPTPTDPASPSAEPSTTSPPPAGKRLTSPGGSVTATCARGRASITGYEPADGYEVEQIDPGPKLTAMIAFRGDGRYRMTITCVAGQPTPVVLPL